MMIACFFACILIPTSFAQWDIINNVSHHTTPTGSSPLTTLSTPTITRFQFPLAEVLKNRSFIVQFKEQGNDFQGVLIIVGTSNIPPKTIEFKSGSQSTTLTCRKQLHGYYYNPARGAGILPLSNANPIPDIKVT